MQLQLDEDQWSRSIVLCSAIFSCQATDMTKLDNCTCLCTGIVERIYVRIRHNGEVDGCLHRGDYNNKI